MTLTYYGHSCFSVTVGGKQLLFDPFVSPNELAKGLVDVNRIGADFILLSHGHADHIADAVSVAKRTGATVVCNWEIYEWLNRQHITQTHPMNIGGYWNFGSFGVKCVNAQHSSSLPDGSYGGHPMGFIITSGEGNFYYSGDTGLSTEMQLIPRWAKLNFAVLPIGDNFTMNATDAAQCALWTECQQVVGVHYDTFGFIKIDHQKALDTFRDAGLILHLLKIGASQEL